MSKLLLIHAGAVIKEYPLEKERITIGRKPHNDIQVDDPAISGEHAMLLVLQNVYIEDRGSTNGVMLNGKKIARRQLNHGDIIHIGHHEFKFVDDKARDFERTVVIAPQGVGLSKPQRPQVMPMIAASIRIISGPKNGEVIPLKKSYTKVGNAEHVAVIARRGSNFFLMPMAGIGDTAKPPRLNENVVGAESLPLKTGDVIEVGGTRLEFSQA